jgi:hypothetical protein
MQVRSKKHIRIFLLMLAHFVGGLSAMATNDPVQTFPLLGSKDSVKVNYISTVVDYQNLLRIANPSMQPLIEAGSTSIQNRVSVGIEEDNKTFIQTDFTVTVLLRIKRYGQTLALIDEFDSTLTINYAKAEGAKYNALKYITFKNAYKVEVKIISINKYSTTWDVAKVLRVDNVLQATRDYVFNCTNAIPGLSVVLDNINGELKAAWGDPNNGQTEYDLEWAWIDESAILDYQTNGQFVEDKLFKNNATRVTTSASTYNIPLLYDGEGRVFVRVRPAQIKISKQRVEGKWTWLNTSNAPVFFTYLGHQNNLNWQASTSFAEEGKRKSVVQYFDGTLRNRQTVTKDNTTGNTVGPYSGANGTTVVAESFYDYQGRPVIQVLPAPTLNTAIAYSQNFNQAVNYVGYPKWAYDKLAANASICGNATVKLDATKGTSKYYSPNNELVNSGNSFNKFIPDAEGYPLTETRFTADGRVAAQGGVGINHQLGSNHETKYIYEPPAQEELDALFGTDAGKASHYFKNIVKDANGQYSISYTDMHGRTIATALAGAAPQALEALPSLNKKYVTKQLLDDETNRVIGKSIISSKSIASLQDGPFTFKYQLNPEQLQLLACTGPYANQQICYDCLYNLKITITSDCNSAGFPYTVVDSNFTIGGSLTNPTCNTANPGKTVGFFNKTFSVWLPEGGYTVTKVLSLSDSAQRTYRDQVYVKYDTCKKLVDFYNEIYTVLVANSNCNITCASCTTAIGNNLAGFRANFVQQTGMPEPLSDSLVAVVTAAYNNAKANCDRICNGVDDDGLEAIRGIKRTMLLDVSPGGQYAKPEEAANIYNIYNTTGNTQGGWHNVFNMPRPAYQNPINYTWNGAAPIVGAGKYKDVFGINVNPQPITISPATFIASGFVSSYAEQLLPHHPEYSKLKAAMEKLPATYKFEADLNKINSWTGLVSATNIPGQYITNILNKDPFFSNVAGTAPGGMYYIDMLEKLAEYLPLTTGQSSCNSGTPTTIGYASLWQIAQAMVFCRNASTVGCENSDQTLCLQATPTIAPINPTTGCANDWNLVWQNFRTMYLTERKKFISYYLNSRPQAVSGSTLSLATFKPRFLDFTTNGTIAGTNLGDLTTLFNQIGAGNTQSVANATALMQAQYDSTCKGYANTWITQISNCGAVYERWQNQNTKTADSTWLVDRLRDICKKGSDPDHFLGAASLPDAMPTNTLGGFRDFPSVIQTFLNSIAPPTMPATATCNKYLITVPKPYNKQPKFISQPIMTKPSDCDCAQISNQFLLYTSASYPGTFSNYLENNYQTYISQGALDTLLQLCNGTYQCVFLPTPIILPPVLQCQTNTTDTTVGTCINCGQYGRIKDSFLIIFNHAAPINNPQTQADVNWNLAFENYANYRTGFSKSWIDYVNFGLACDSVQTIPCASLDSVLQLFYLSSIYQQAPLGIVCRQNFANFFNNAFGLSNNYDQWMYIFLQSCGQKPDPCGRKIKCTDMNNAINAFYTTYGANIHNNANCMQLFVSFMNNALQVNFTYTQLEAVYKFTCGVNCSLDICTFPNCFLLTKAYNQFMADNNGHPWMLPNCQLAFVNFFNTYFGLTTPYTFIQISDAYANCQVGIGGMTTDGCAPDIKNLCAPNISCPSMQYVVQLFHDQYDGITLANCQDTFRVFFNTLMHTSYNTYQEVVDLYVKLCGAAPDVCGPVAVSCQKLFLFLSSFAFDKNVNSCETIFVSQFNSHFGTNYTSMADIQALYLTHCSYVLNICDGVAPTDCAPLEQLLHDFYALYPDPATQLGSSCQNTFVGFFKGRFGYAAINFMGFTTYADVSNYYLQMCGYSLNICAGNGIAIGGFVSRFNTRFGTFKMPLMARKELFAYLYNKEFITGVSLNADNSNLVVDGSGLVAVEAPVEGVQQPLLSYEEIADAVLTTAHKNSIAAAPTSSSVFDPQVLLSMKQIYYLLHPAGLASNCEDDFSSWFNISMGTNYAYSQLFTQYNNICGANTGYICSLPENDPKATYTAPSSIIGASNNSIYQPPTLCGLNEPVFHPIPVVLGPCKDLAQITLTAAEIKFELYLDSVKNVFDLAYYNKCMAAKNLESFTVSDTLSVYHYTLYYYDQAGNLVKTVPPAGVNRLTDAQLIDVKNARAAGTKYPVNEQHSLVTEYRYNTLNQVVAQKTPDAGVSKFWYDRLGRLVTSQNAKQITTNKYSYTLYDNLGRINEVGQLANATAINQATTQNQVSLDLWIKDKPADQITRTVYDKSYFDGAATLSPSTLTQKNLRNRVSYTAVYSTGVPGLAIVGDHKAATFYSYDIHGNVDTLLQDYNDGAMKLAGNRFKKMVYEYDLISGKVNTVAYQPNQVDAFYHKYSYDAENRLTDVETSGDKIIWEKDARYQYYKHGALARTILGQQQVQGIDYAYTIQGWLKGVNSTSVGDDGFYDMGQDGMINGYNGNVAKDVYGFALNYFNTDYKPINTIYPFTYYYGTTMFSQTASDGSVTAKPLYNGNIASMFVNIPKLGDAQLYGYKYDQLNRIKNMDVFRGFVNGSNNFLNPVAVADYKERLTYDANGNIKTYLRNGIGATINLNNYSYTYTAGTNRLASITNSVPATAVTKTYAYDDIGNTTNDGMQGMTNAVWNLYGKLQSCTNKDGASITYTYSTDGQRISKKVGAIEEWYVKDASGNTMATYKKDATINAGRLSTSELYKYGSGLLGIKNKIIDVQAVTVASTIFVRGEDGYILTDHRNNTQAVISDKKLQVQNPANTTQVLYYLADVKTATYYSTYGATAKSFGQTPLLAFNGQRKSTEIGVDAQTALFWEYNGDVGRRANLDPKSSTSISPYNCYSGNPILFIDIKGDTIHDNTGFVAQYKVQAQQGITTLTNAENQILSIPATQRSAFQNTSLTNIQGARQELISSLDEISQMETSSVHFNINSTTDLAVSSIGEGATTTFANFDKQRVEVNINFNTIGTNRGVVGHELKHGFQMLNGRSNSGSLNDMNDEIEAYSLQRAFEGTANAMQMLLLQGGLNPINETSVRTLGSTMTPPAYQVLAVVTSGQTSRTLMNLITQNFNAGTSCARGDSCGMGEMYIRKTVNGYADSFDDFRDGANLIKR